MAAMIVQAVNLKYFLSIVEKLGDFFVLCKLRSVAIVIAYTNRILVVVFSHTRRPSHQIPTNSFNERNRLYTLTV